MATKNWNTPRAGALAQLTVGVDGVVELRELAEPNPPPISSPDSPALLLSKLDRAGRDTLSAFAASVTDNPAGSTISVRMKSPG